MTTVRDLVPTATTLTLIGHNGQELEDTPLADLHDRTADLLHVLPNAHAVLPGLSSVLLNIQAPDSGWDLYRTYVPDADAPTTE